MATGHIRKRISKKGEVTYQIIVEDERDPITGKRNRHYKTIKGTKKEAQAEYLKMVNQLNDTGLTKSSAMKLSDWLCEWHNIYLPNLEYRTKESYLERINHRIIPTLGNIQLKALQASTIQKWINALSEELSPKSVQNIFNILKASLTKAVELKKLASNPCIGIVLPKKQKYQADTYSNAEIQQALSLAKGSDMYLILLLTFSLGLRRGELIALTWDDVDFEKAEININKSSYTAKGQRKVKKPKTDAGIRTLALGSNIINELKVAYTEYRKRKLEMGNKFNDSNLVICKADGSPYHPDSLSNKWKRFIKKHNLKSIRFHDMRHTNATTLIAAGVDIKTVQARLGHSDISTTMNIYAHVTNDMNVNAAKKIDDIISA